MVTAVLQLWIIVVLFLMLAAPCSSASRYPVLNEGKKWRIGYYEGGEFSDYTETMRTFIDGLMQSGWINTQPIPYFSGNMIKPYWDWLTKCESRYLTFDHTDSYSSNWDEEKREANRLKMLQKLRTKSLDLVVAMGTWAGQDLANDEHKVPVMVLSTSNPVHAGIISSEYDSGYDHVTARVDPTRYLRQLRMFSRIVKFDTLGVAYENNSDGKIYSALKEVYRISSERGFRVELCEVDVSGADTAVADQSCMACYEKLADKADAIYLTALTCVDRQVSRIAEMLREKRIPSFSLMGSRFVKAGIMLSISSDSEYVGLGRYNADKFSRILNGARPRELNQVFEDPLHIAVNKETVRRLNFDLPHSILRIATETYE